MQSDAAHDHGLLQKSDTAIRPIMASDKEPLSYILKQGGTFNEKEIEVAMEVIDDAINFPEKDYYTFCALAGKGDVAGFICFGPIPMTDGCYDLYWIAVDKKFSRNGIGKKLLATMEKYAVKEKIRHIYVDTSSTAPYTEARIFYENQGYHIAAVFHDFYRPGDDKIIFMKELPCDES